MQNQQISPSFHSGGVCPPQERVQRRAGQTLSYTVCAESGPDHNKTFTMAVLLNGSEIGRGTGRTKKEAEQSAARCALEQMTQ